MRLFEGTPFDIPPRCERCHALVENCSCPPEPPPRVAPERQTARLGVEKRKRGKVVTVIRGLAAADNDLPALLSQLKTACGAGGTVRGDELEIQGAHLERAKNLLREQGYRIRG